MINCYLFAWSEPLVLSHLKIQLHNCNLSKEVLKVETVRIVCHSKIEITIKTGTHAVVCMKEKLKKVQQNNKITMKKDKVSYEAKLE